MTGAVHLPPWGFVKGRVSAIILVMSATLDRYVAQVEERLANADETTANPVLVMLTGLPGTGKSHLARRLAEVLPFVIVESDQVRKTLFPECDYTGEESQWVHRTCHAVIEKLLRKGVRVIYDATNLHERHREQVYRLADETQAKLLVVKVVAPEAVASARLQGRREDGTDNEDVSDADWRVYRRMARDVEPIARSFVVVDTSRDMGRAISKLLRLLRP
ncbi:MAG: ATP-binding protein, partial [Anaerolineae bacterium]|nr:ATP-binding protein [Anaerolineae bacterium]